MLHDCQPPFSRDFTIIFAPDCRAFSGALKIEKLKAPLITGPKGAVDTNDCCINGNESHEPTLMQTHFKLTKSKESTLKKCIVPPNLLLGVITVMKLWHGGLILILGTSVYQWMDTPLPQDMEDKWKIRLSEAVMRTCGKLVCL